jgi:hypothetical protein
MGEIVRPDAMPLQHGEPGKATTPAYKYSLPTGALARWPPANGCSPAHPRPSGAVASDNGTSAGIRSTSSNSGATCALPVSRRSARRASPSAPRR